MSKVIPSYPSIERWDHYRVADVFDGPVLIQEKIDGSQFSAQLIDGELHFRSKGATKYLGDKDALFSKTMAHLDSVKGLMNEGFIYRGEAMCSPKHNSLQYERAPKGNFVLYDIELPDGSFLPNDHIAYHAGLIGVDYAPTYHVGEISKDGIDRFLGETPLLGGKFTEGFVIKNYAKRSGDGKVKMAKYVRPEFKEIHANEWKVTNPSRGDIIEGIIAGLSTDARRQKALQHLREAGLLENEYKDIPKVLNEIKTDILKEEEDEIKNALFKHFWADIARGVTRGVPEWYKGIVGGSKPC